jgi:large subunit ribosomal protein L5
MQTLKEKYKRIIKVVVSAGLGSRKDDKEKMKGLEKSLSLITGQKPKVNLAKKSIAGFKLRQGMPIGYSVTLRGTRMYDFLEKFINVALPRMRDFRGLSPDLIDEAGNMTIGLREHIVFPEVSKEDIKSAFGLGVTIVTNAKTKEEAFEIFRSSDFPFKK